ncbi:MAG: hypothetical protein RIT81_06120 [Deltaproteobacteria bacterium]
MSEDALPPEGAPPPIPPAELPEEELRRLVDEGRIAEIERVLREQNVRLPQVLDQLERVLAEDLGNLATAMVSMLIGRFHVARASQLAERVLSRADTAGADALADLAAALMQQERLITARKVVDAALGRDPHHDRALYLSARISARRGRLDDAFTSIAKVNPKVLEAHGLLHQARYALLTGRDKAYASALSLAKKAGKNDDTFDPLGVEALAKRLQIASVDPTQPMTLRTSMALEYGSALVEVERSGVDGGRFDMEPMAYADLGPLVRRMVATIRSMGAPLTMFYHATEDGEIVAAAMSQIAEVPYREWASTRDMEDGAWLVMGSASTHPHLDNKSVRWLGEALSGGVLRTAALIMPCGWRGPIVPDVIGRITGDDELPWAIDDEVEDTVELIFEPDDDSREDAAQDDEVLERHLERFGGIFRATQPEPRDGHVPFHDETPVPRTQG